LVALYLIVGVRVDSEITVGELKNKVKRFCEARDWDRYHDAKNLAIGIATESGELLEKFRFKSSEETEEILKSSAGKEEISDEIADILYFTLRFAQKYGIDLSDSLDNKIEKNENKYPVDKAKGSNKKYNEL
jgi:NTP pyrophosphatase (non-canonical NTP hydrolase)